MSRAPESRRSVFISYSHADRAWLARLSVHLKPLERRYDIEVWDDRRIEAGRRWSDEIDAALRASTVAFFLVTADLLASDFIAEHELPRLLQAAEETGTAILSLIISPSLFADSRLAEYQTVNDPSKPLIDLPRGAQEAVFVKAAKDVLKRLLKGRTDHVEDLREHWTGSFVDRAYELLSRSEASAETGIRFFNDSTSRVDVFWVDYEGTEKLYVSLDPGFERELGTYVSHPWVVRLADSGVPVALIVAEKEERVLEITDSMVDRARSGPGPGTSNDGTPGRAPA